MNKFQILAIITLLFILISLFRRVRRPAIDKVLIGFIFVTAGFFIMYPDATNKIAHYVGIGRGADLIFYVAVLGFSYTMTVLYSKINKLEKQLESLIRNEAISHVTNAESIR